MGGFELVAVVGPSFVTEGATVICNKNHQQWNPLIPLLMILRHALTNTVINKLMDRLEPQFLDATQCAFDRKVTKYSIEESAANRDKTFS